MCPCGSPGLGRDKCHPDPLCKESCLSRHQHLGCDNWVGPPARTTPSRTASQAVPLALHSLRILGTVCWRWLGCRQKSRPPTARQDQKDSQGPHVLHSKLKPCSGGKEYRQGASGGIAKPCQERGVGEAVEELWKFPQGQEHRLQQQGASRR